MSAFVLGATGFVGREVVRQLCVRGSKTHAHVRPDLAFPTLDALGRDTVDVAAGFAILFIVVIAIAAGMADAASR